MKTPSQIPVFSPSDNETKVREAFVFPLLKTLGYENEEIAPEVYLLFRHKESQDKADYIITKEHKYELPPNKLVVEVKNPTITLPDNLVLQQAQEYAFHPSVQASFILLVNGIELEIYSSIQSPPLHIASFKVQKLEQDWERLNSIIGAESLGSYFAGLKLDSPAGRGGYGQVFKAWNERLRRYEAIKVLLPNGEKADSWLHRFERGAQGLAALKHPYICEVYDINSYRGRPYYRMELIDGVNLTEFVTQNNLSLPERLLLFEKICEALLFAHQQEVFHCDLKPDNILVQSDGTPKLIDFDFCHINNRSVTFSSQIIATLAYMDPTIWGTDGDEPKRDHLADIFSTGLLLWSILTGKVLPMRWTTTYLINELSSSIPDNEDAMHLAHVIMECIQNDRRQRPQSVGELAKLLGLKEKRKSFESSMAGATNIFTPSSEKIAFQYHFRLWDNDKTIPSSTDFHTISKNLPNRPLTEREREFIFRAACEHWSVDYRIIFKEWAAEDLIRCAEAVLTDPTIEAMGKHKIADTSPARKAVGILRATDEYRLKNESEKVARFLLNFLVSGKHRELFHTILEDLSKLQCFKNPKSKLRHEATKMIIDMLKVRLPNASASSVSQIGKLLEKLDPKICGEDSEEVAKFIGEVATYPGMLNKAVLTLSCFESAYATDQFIALLKKYEEAPEFEAIALKAVGIGGKHKRPEAAQYLAERLDKLKDQSLIRAVKKLSTENIS